MNFYPKIFDLFFFVLFLYGCELDTGQKDPNANLIIGKDGKIIEGEYTKFFDDGKVAAIVNFKDRELDGKAVKFYDDGITKRSELNYSAGKLEGVQKRYYESGALYKEEMYVGDKRNGITRKFREGGNLMSEAIFKNSFPGTNLKEYLTDGKLKKKYPSIVIEEDKYVTGGSYSFRVFLSDESQKVVFYFGQLDEGEYLNDRLIPQQNVVDNVLTYTIYLHPGERVRQEINIVAKVITRLNNVYITTRKHTVIIRDPR